MALRLRSNAPTIARDDEDDVLGRLRRMRGETEEETSSAAPKTEEKEETEERDPLDRLQAMRTPQPSTDRNAPTQGATKEESTPQVSNSYREVDTENGRIRTRPADLSTPSLQDDPEEMAAELNHLGTTIEDTGTRLGALSDQRTRANVAAQTYGSQVKAFETKLGMLKDTIANSEDPEERRRATQEAQALDLYYQKAQRAAERYGTRAAAINSEFEGLVNQYDTALQSYQALAPKYTRRLELGGTHADRYQAEADELIRRADTLSRGAATAEANAGAYGVGAETAGKVQADREAADRLTAQARDLLNKADREREFYSTYQYMQYMSNLNEFRQDPEFEVKSQADPALMQAKLWSHGIGGIEKDWRYKDIDYAIINGSQDAYRASIDAESFNLNDKAYLQNLTDEERAYYNYLYKTQGKAKADEFIKQITPQLNEIQRGKNQTWWQDYARNQWGAASAFSVLEKPMAVMSLAMQFADYADDGRIDRNAGHNKFAQIPTDIRAVAAEKYDEKGVAVYQQVMSMADNVYNRLITAGFGMSSETAGGVMKFVKGMTSPTIMLMMGEAAADSIIANKNLGMDDDRAIILGIGAGLIEGITENVSLEQLLNPGQLADGIVMTLAKMMLAEGSEEGASDLLNWAIGGIYDTISGMDESEYRQKIRQYVKDGMSTEEAAKTAMKERYEELALDILGGAISGGIMGGSNYMFNRAKVGTASSAIGRFVNPDNIQSMIERGMLAPEGSEARNAAVAVQDRIARGQRITNAEIGRLALATARLMGETTPAAEGAGITEAPEAAAPVEAANENAPPVPGAVQENGPPVPQGVQNAPQAEQTAENAPPVPGEVRNAAETAGTVQETEAVPQTAESPTGRARLEAAMAAEGQTETTAAQAPGETNAEAAGEKVTQRTLASERQKTAEKAASLRDAGFTTAGEDATARIRSEESWDAEEKAVGQALRDLGYEPTFAVGLIENAEGKSVPYLLEGNKLAVRSDHRSRSVQEIAEKAVGQALDIDQGVRNQVMETITQARAEARAARQTTKTTAEKPTVSARAQATMESARAAGASEEDGALAGRLADIIGRDIRFFNEAGKDGAWKNGYTQNGVIYINAQAKKPVAWVVGHELTHNVEHSKIYDSLKKLAQKEMGLNWSMRVQSRLDASARIAQKLGDESVRLTDPADAEREIVADFFADRLLSDEAAIRKVCEYEPVTARNIRDYIKGLLRKLGGKETTLERALTLYNKALKDVAAKAQADAENKLRLKGTPEAQKQESGLKLGGKQYSTADEVLARTDIDWMDDNSSIKEQLERHADDLGQMDPVVAVEYNPASAKKLVKLMLDEVSKIGGKRMSRIGISFDFDQKGAENIDRHAETDEKRAAALAAPYVAKYGKVIAGQKNHEGTGLTTITIGAPVVINGTTVNEGVVVQFDKNGRPRAINVGLQGGGVFSIKKLETLKGPGSRVYRIGKGTALPTMSASKGTIAETKGKGKRQFSISDTVEETKDLIAIHNLTERNLIDMGELGGAPAPSIAIVKAKAGHTKYGPISLVYSKNTIDPRKNAKNKVYGSDAWTPTAPRIEYEINEKAARSFESKIYELSKKVANGMFGNSGALRQTGVEDDTSLTAEDLAEKLANTDAVRAAYLADNGGNVEVQRKEKVFSQRGNEFLQKIINRFGAQKLAETVSNLIQNDRVSDEDIERLREVYKQDIIDTYPRRLVEKRGAEAIARVADRRASEASSRQLEFFAMEAWEYYEDGGKTKDEIDRLATSNKLQEAARHDDVVNWLMPQLEQVLGKRGIYNGKDPYTASGNRRGFNALHDPYTLENIVKAMSKDDQRGANIWGIGAGTLQSVTTPSYRSIAEIKADSGRLGAVDSEIYDNLKKELDARIESAVQAIFNSTRHYDDNIFSERDNIAQAIIDAARGSRTENSIRQSMQKNGYTVSMKIAAELSSIFDDAAQLPTEYFEAKPMRAVGFDEIVAAVVPDNISARAQKVLDDNGVNTLNYKAGDDTDRIEKLNSIPDVQFSAEDSDDEYRQAPGTEALDKLGIRLAGSKGKYHLAEQLLERDKAAKELMKATKKAERKLKATKAEKEFAAGIAAGIYEERDIPSSMNKDTVATLADYYAAEESFKANMLAEVRGRINAEYQDEAEELLSNVDRFKKLSMLMLNERTPDRTFRAMFGPTQGKAIFDWLIRPVQMNEAAKTRWHQEQMDKVRQFEDSKGKTRALTRAESELTMLVMEGKAAAAAVADMEKKGLDAKGIRNAAENIRNGEDAADAAWEFGLKDREREIAKNYARWMDTQEKLKSADSTIIENAAEAYSKIFDEFYDGINDFLVAHGYEPIGYIKGYAPHMQPEETQSLLEKAFDKMGISLGNDKAQGLPASIAGETAYFKPNKRWDPYFLHRTGTQAEYDIEKAYQSYVGYLSDILFHTDDIMRVRNMERMIRKTYASDEIKENLDWIQEIRNSPSEERLGMLRDAGKIGKTTILSGSEVNDKLDEWEEEEFNALKEDRQYNNLVMWLSNYANLLAGKQSFADRGWEYSLGRNSLNFANRLQAAFQRSLVAGSLTSALNQMAQLPMIKAELGDRWYYAALKDILTGQTRGFWKDSDFLTGKHGVDMLYTDNYDKFISALFKPSTAVDYIVSTTAVRGAFLKAIHQGQSYSEAMRTADDFGRRVMGSREKGTRPLAYESKGLFSRMIHMFQVEAANSWDHIASDLPYEIKEIARTQGKPKAARTLAALIVKALLSTFLLNRLTEETYGGTPAPFDVIGLALNFVASGQGMTTNQYLKTIIDNGLEQIGSDRFFGTEDVDAEFDVGKGLEELGYNVMNDVPLLRNLAGVLGLGDQTVPLPGAGGEFKDLKTAVEDLIEDGADMQEVNNALWALGKLLMQFVPAGRQLTKTAEGVKAVIQEGSYSKKENLQYPIDTTADKIRAIFFGKNATNAARDHWASGEGTLSEKQTALVKTMREWGVSGADAVKIVRKISKIEQAGGSQKEAVVEYIGGLTLTSEQKDQIYLAQNYAESGLDETPWHAKGGSSGRGKTYAPADTGKLMLPPSARMDEQDRELWDMEGHGGNVNLRTRKTIPVTNDNIGTVKGWGMDSRVGDYMTVASQTYRDGDRAVVVTPILPDGSLMTQKELDAYMESLRGSADYADADDRGIILGVFDNGSWQQNLRESDAFAERIHELHEEREEKRKTTGLKLPSAPQARTPISSGLRLPSTPAAKPSKGGLKLR